MKKITFSNKSSAEYFIIVQTCLWRDNHLSCIMTSCVAVLCKVTLAMSDDRLTPGNNKSGSWHIRQIIHVFRPVKGDNNHYSTKSTTNHNIYPSVAIVTHVIYMKSGRDEIFYLMFVFLFSDAMKPTQSGIQISSAECASG